MGGCSPYIQPRPCPGCGKKIISSQGNSAWEHSYMVCSEECGLAIKATLEEMRGEDYYKFLVTLKRDTEDRINSFESEALSYLRED